MNPLQEISIDRIDAAIATMRQQTGKSVSLVQYGERDVSLLTVTLPELYRELARRIEEGTAVLRAALVDAEQSL